MTERIAFLTNSAFGYPGRGDSRRIAPRRLMCIHITANPGIPPATATQERDYANRAGSSGPSAHSYIDRNGDIVHAIDPLRYAAWSNGAVRSPKLTTPGIKEVVALDATVVPGSTTTYNANEDYHREVETCGRYSAYLITQAQEEAIASLIARDSVDTGLSISRATVHLHSDIDTEQRPNCPVPAASAEPFVARIIARANDIHRALVETTMTWEELLALIDQRYKEALGARDEAEAARDVAMTSEATVRVTAQAAAAAMTNAAAEIAEAADRLAAL